MERYLAHEQLSCGGWEAWPNSNADIDVTLVCALALANSETTEGRAARDQAEVWLLKRMPPELDSFWLGYLALNEHLPWTEVPHLTPRLTTAPKWWHPNIYDFSFLRIAVVATSLLQDLDNGSEERQNTSAKQTFEHNPEFDAWIRNWIRTAYLSRFGFLALISKSVRGFDRIFTTRRHLSQVISWLLDHQECDGSFFSSVHMTSIAIVTLHRIDSERYLKQIEAGLSAMRNWQVREDAVVWQQFTDSTTWDTALFLDLLQRIGGESSNTSIQRSIKFLCQSQNLHCGDWSARVKQPAGGGWCFQRTGKWYPDCDDTAVAVSTLLELNDPSLSAYSRRGIEWLLSMQCSNGGWASWDRNDRAWMKIPKGGRWFARDLPTSDITSRVVILLTRVGRNDFPGLEDLKQPAALATDRALVWLKNQDRGGRWFGSWFTHYLYGTSLALEAFREVGQSTNIATFKSAQEWINSVVNSDGGFGESPQSSADGKFVGASSTPFHTACGLTSLVHVGAAQSSIARKAAEWLIVNQNDNGTWTNDDFFAAGVPGLWYANFSNTPTYFAAKSLAAYRDEL